jgi:hypothetical protein
MGIFDSFLNPLDSKNWGSQLQNGVTAAYNPFKAGNETLHAATGGAPAGASTASDTYAALTREQWENYVTTFVPIENQLIQYATNDQQPLIEAQAAGQQVRDQFGQAGANEQRRLQSLGITLSPQEAAASGRQTDNDRALAMVQGQNLAMDLTRQRQQGILGNPAPSTGSIASQASGLQV